MGMALERKAPNFKPQTSMKNLDAVGKKGSGGEKRAAEGSPSLFEKG